MVPEQLRGKRIGILGFGANHRALLGWLLTHGAEDVTVYDEDPGVAERVRSTGLRASVVAKPGALDQIESDVVFRSPGIPLHRLDALREQGIRITSQTELFLQVCPAATIGVTGTKGKSTVSSLIAELLKVNCQLSKVKCQVYLAGNIGKDPFEFLDELTKDDTVVLELSSFQLDGIQQSPRIAVVLDVSVDHLDHHASLTAYHDAKSSIVRSQGPGDVAVLNLSSQVALGYAALAGGTVVYYASGKSVDAGCYLIDGTYWWRDPALEIPEEVATAEELGIEAPHNQENAAAAMAVAKLLGIPNETIVVAIRSFSGLPHRLELVAEIGHVRWINDSYATVPDATMAAFASFGEAPLLLIVGGYDKGVPWQALGAAIASHAPKLLLTIGQTGPAIAQAAVAAGYPEERIVAAETLTQAVAVAAQRATAGDVVLLSPASASFDQFDNVTHRGEVFRSLVAKLRPGLTP
ncbi:UDP-N-acetylmuramoyl-L-alanine--D-glutamate ligase [Candidatus Berkelbacteria bacterium]|nr:UDP-N-acetylmuramoyl-L-alanine--D-glutamate ligase [Candidatus Berkelbacteria bacterium]